VFSIENVAERAIYRFCWLENSAIFARTGGLIQGWGRIAESWEQIFNMSEHEDGGMASAGAAARISIGLQPETVRVNLPPGSGVAWVTGVEVFGGDEEGHDPADPSETTRDMEIMNDEGDLEQGQHTRNRSCPVS